MKNFKNILFDLDGTLTDPKEGIINSYLFSLNKFGIHEENPESLTEFIGNPLQDCFSNKYGFKGDALKLAITYYREYFADKGAYENHIYPGIEKMLNRLNEKKLYIVTTKAKLFADKILVHFNIRNYFTTVYGSELHSFDFLNKSKGDLINEAINNEKFILSETLMVGDRKFDVIGARQNGIKSAAVTYGYGSVEELKNSEPDFLVNNVEELKDLTVEKKQ